MRRKPPGWAAWRPAPPGHPAAAAQHAGMCRAVPRRAARPAPRCAATCRAPRPAPCLQHMGTLFQSMSAVNLLGRVLDTPDSITSAPDNIGSLYKSVRQEAGGSWEATKDSGVKRNGLAGRAVDRWRPVRRRAGQEWAVACLVHPQLQPRLLPTHCLPMPASGAAAVPLYRRFMSTWKCCSGCTFSTTASA